MRLMLATLFAVCAAPVFAQQSLPSRDVVSAAITEFIRPGFHQLAQTTGSMRTDIAALCATPSQAALETAREQFKAVVIAYSGIEFVQVGPLAEGGRPERLLFWPDRKGIALKQVQQALASKDATATKPETLLQKSVAMQGLGALEFLLFGTGAETLASADDPYRCAYSQAIATLLGDLTTTLDQEWADPDGVTQALLNPQADARDFRTETESLEKVAATLVHGTEALRDQRLKPIQGVAEGQPKPKSALFWRSNMTIPAAAANFAALSEFFEKARFPEALGPDNAPIVADIEAEFAKASSAAALVTSPMEQAVTDPKQFQAIDDMVVVTRSLDMFIGENLAQVLGLSVGFSALDGD